MKKNLLLVTVILLFGCNQIDTPLNKVVPQEEMKAIHLLTLLLDLNI